MLPVQFRAIQRQQPFSRAQSHRLISRHSRERSFYNFGARPLSIFVIWFKYATRAIMYDSETATSSNSLSPTLIYKPSWERFFYNFRAQLLPIIVICLNMLLVRFQTILKWQPFLRMQSRTLISQSPREHSFYNFRERPLPIIVNWCKYATRAITCNSKTATFFARTIAHANIPTLPGALLL